MEREPSEAWLFGVVVMAMLLRAGVEVGAAPIDLALGIAGMKRGVWMRGCSSLSDDVEDDGEGERERERTLW